MTFNEAYEELRKLADGHAFALTYERASYLPTIEIRAYIDREGIHHARQALTYEEAINNMRNKLGEPLIGKADEAPGGEDED